MAWNISGNLKGPKGDDVPQDVLESKQDKLLFPLDVAHGGTGASTRGEALTGLANTGVTVTRDWNEYVTPGTYIVVNNSFSNTTNAPENVYQYGMLEVSYSRGSDSGTTAVVQRYTTHTAVSCFRVKFDDEWSTWSYFKGLWSDEYPVKTGSASKAAKIFGTELSTATYVPAMETNYAKTGTLPICGMSEHGDKDYAIMNRATTKSKIEEAFASRTATTVADNDLLPTNALMMDYVGNLIQTYRKVKSYLIPISNEQIETGTVTVSCNPWEYIVCQGITSNYDADIPTYYLQAIKATSNGYDYVYHYKSYSITNPGPSRSLTLTYILVSVGRPFKPQPE